MILYFLELIFVGILVFVAISKFNRHAMVLRLIILISLFLALALRIQTYTIPLPFNYFWGMLIYDLLPTLLLLLTVTFLVILIDDEVLPTSNLQTWIRNLAKILFPCLYVLLFCASLIIIGFQTVLSLFICLLIREYCILFLYSTKIESLAAVHI